MPPDPETLALLRAVFDEACGLLPPHRRSSEIRSTLAVRILQHAARGERNPKRLRSYALAETIGALSPDAKPARLRPGNGGDR